MLSVMRPAEDLGVYTVAYRFLEQALILPRPADGGGLPAPRARRAAAFARREGDPRPRRLAPARRRRPTHPGPACLRPALVRLVAREDFENAIAPLRILSLAMVPAFVNAPLALLLVALDRRRDLVDGECRGPRAERRDESLGDSVLRLRGRAVTTVVSEFVGVALVAWFARRAYPLELGGLVAVRGRPAAISAADCAPEAPLERPPGDRRAHDPGVHGESPCQALAAHRRQPLDHARVALPHDRRRAGDLGVGGRVPAAGLVPPPVRSGLGRYAPRRPLPTIRSQKSQSSNPTVSSSWS